MKVEKIIGRKILFQFVIIFIALFFPLMVYMLNEKRINVNDDQKIVLREVVQQWENAKIDLANNIELFQKDYANRAQSVEYILNTKGMDSVTNEELKNMTQILQVASINLVSSNGEILFSSIEEIVGLNLKEYTETIAFWDMIDGVSSEEAIVQIGETKIISGEQCVLVGIKSKLSGIAMIQMEVPISVYEQVIKPFTIETLISRIPTEDEKAIFAVDNNTGDLLAITSNNEQTVIFKEGQTKEEFLETLKGYRNQFTVKINDKSKHLSIVETDEYIFGCWTDSSYTYRNATVEALVLVCILLISLCCIYLIVSKLIKKYVIKDIENINEVVNFILEGNIDTDFATMSSLEFQNLTNILDKWKENYKNKSERLTRLVEKINPNVAVFECHHTMNQVFYSENLKELFAIDDADFLVITRDSQTFEKFISSVKKREDSHQIINIGERYISVDTLGEGDVFYGVIVDKTSGIVRMKNAEKKLESAIDETKRDPLTGLYNRKGIEEEINILLQKNPNVGIMMMLDLDNFKKINDNEGHQIGDKALKVFANCLRKIFRPEDIIARMGGDEFTVFIASHLNEQSMKQKCERLLEQSRIALKEYYKKYNVSVSIGVAYISNDTKTYEQLYKSSDSALYKAKNSGKNTFYLYQDKK